MATNSQDVKITLSGKDATGSTFAQVNNKLRELSKSARLLNATMKFGGFGLALNTFKRVLDGSVESMQKLKFPEQYIKDAKRATEAIDRLWDETKAFVGWVAANAVTGFDVMFGTGGPGTRQSPKSTIPGLKKTGFGLPGDYPMVGKQAQWLDKLVAHQKALPKETDQSVRREVQNAISQAFAELIRLRKQREGGYGLQRLPGLFGDIGRNMYGGMQTNLRGLGIFGAGVGRSMGDLGADMGGRFGRRGEREDMMEGAYDQRTQAIRAMKVKSDRLHDMVMRDEMKSDDAAAIRSGMLRDFDSQYSDAQRRGVGASGGRFLTMGATQDPMVKAQGETNKILKEAKKTAEETLKHIRVMAGHKPPGRGPGFN